MRILFSALAILLAGLAVCHSIRHDPLLGDLNIDDHSYLETFNKPNPFDHWKIAEPSKGFKYIPNVLYEGKFEIDKSTASNDKPAENNSLKLKSPLNLHAIMHFLDDPIVSNGTKDIVLQYEVKLPADLQCGGGYIKLITFDDTSYDKETYVDKFDDEKTHIVVFGPDKCMSNSRMHYFILANDPKKNEKLMRNCNKDMAIGDRDDESNLYTLVIKPNGSFKIKINGVMAETGTVYDFEPPIYPPEKIIDPNAVDPNKDYKNFIQDETAQKPDDWDESLPKMVPDPNDTKPSDWNDNEEPYIEAEGEEKENHRKLWDELLLGPYVPLKVPNPKCIDLKCGVWSPKIIPNPDYRGPWSPPIIPNPVPPVNWEPPLIDNPEYTGKIEPLALGTINGVLIDIWTTNSEIEYDNIYIGHSEDEADYIASLTFKKTSSSVPSSKNNFLVIRKTINIVNSVIADPHMALSTLRKYVNKYKNQPRSIIHDIKQLRGDLPLTLLVSSIIASLLTILYTSMCAIKKCLCHTSSSKHSAHTPKSSSKKSSDATATESKTEDASSSDSDSDDATTTDNATTKGLKRRKGHAKSPSAASKS